jgi:hypothetical protein
MGKGYLKLSTGYTQVVEMVKNPDFGQVEELFMRKVRTQTCGADLAGLIAHAIAMYEQEIRIFPSSHVDVLYPSSNPSVVLTLTVAYQFSAPNISGFKLTGHSDQISDVLSLMNGTFSAQFNGLPFDDIPRRYRARLSREGGQQIADRLLFHFMDQGENGLQLKLLDYQRPTGKLLPWDELQAIPMVVLSEVLNKPLVDLLSKAARIQIDNDHYTDDHWSKPLLREDCNITQRDSGEYNWVYNIRTVNRHTLPAEVAKRVMELFTPVARYFSEDSLEMHTLVRPSQKGTTRGLKYYG